MQETGWMTDRSDLEEAARSAIGRGLDWLLDNQEASGELASFATPLGSGTEPVWTRDSLKFITALVALACAQIADPRASAVIDSAVGFLTAERERTALWRYWTRANEQFGYTPPDADDTACCSMAVALRGQTTVANVPVLLANRDGDGRFYTWVIPHQGLRSPRLWWAVRDEFRPSVRQRRDELWRNTEAWPDDVDGVVNANVIRYLGPDRAPTEPVEWVVDIVRSGHEDDCDSWHRNRYTLYASVADGARRGIAAFTALGPAIVERIARRVEGDGHLGTSLDTALALVALAGFDGPVELQQRLRSALLERQMADGSWERSVFYFGGPDEVFGWGSEALSTATALQALSVAAVT
jgi:hypothetical protein